MLTLLAFFVMALFHTENTHLDLEYGPGIVEKLKTKFHRLAGVGRNTSRVLKQTHSSSVFNNNYGDDEPEFLRVARSLRRKAGYADDVQSECECKLIDEGVGKQSGWHSLKSYQKDASGMVEMQKLLDKFQRTRAERQLNMAEYPSPTQSLSSSTITVTNRQDISVAVSDAILFQQSRSHTVVSVRSSDLSTSSPSSQIHYLEKDSSPGIVSISVKEDENMFSHGRRIHNTSMSSSTEPSPVVKHTIHSPLLWKSSRLEQLDNDLPSNYEEWKKEDEKKMHSEVEHAIESHTLSKIVAGDGNLVSHTLLNLAMEEDIPALMEAMHETYSFEFEDLKDETPSSSSILHTPETRKARRKARQVYTYLDEVSAIVKREWVDGVHVDYETYQSVNSTNQDDCNTTDIRDCKKDLYSLYIEEQANDDDAPFDMSVSPKIAQWQSRIQNTFRMKPFKKGYVFEVHEDATLHLQLDRSGRPQHREDVD
ncbi:unnamed protein product [Nippostrongylus brasiliensis]|uniref:ANK_REP_REGION domain-containing protein n=1 Tax=Nippostrongylus brasiliensis TaxID=27835 RepID=A0A0N4XT02_NIPBR|nr:unnamed protein product [Nippostrongylus brasiliensis]